MEDDGGGNGCTVDEENHGELRISEGPSPLALPRYGRVMVVDDEIVNRAVLSAIIRRRCRPCITTVDHVSDGREAVLLFTQNIKYDVVFMDESMPVMDGIDATKA